MKYYLVTTKPVDKVANVRRVNGLAVKLSKRLICIPDEGDDFKHKVEYYRSSMLDGWKTTILSDDEHYDFKEINKNQVKFYQAIITKWPHMLKIK